MMLVILASSAECCTAPPLSEFRPHLGTPFCDGDDLEFQLEKLVSERRNLEKHLSKENTVPTLAGDRS